MSAVRNNSNRSEARKKRSTPYSRGFGIIGTISRFINYFTGTPSEHPAEADSEDNYGRSNGRHFIASSPKSNFSSEPSSLPVPNAEQVASYFTQRMGTNVTTNEVESIITNLQTSPERERFRFTFTTPGRISSPSFSPPNITPSVSPRASPSKKLARNPNGSYRWEGGGSAKAARQRNRFASPAFRASPVKTGRPNTQESAGQSTLPVQDVKRRKLGDTSVQPSNSNVPTTNGVPFPNMPSTPRTNGFLSQTSPLPSSRLRTPAKPTVPFNPSPLRQAWSDASSTSSPEDNKPIKPTKAANLVAELIKETAPPNKPDLSNPYQTASPVSKVGPPRRATKRPRAVGRPPLPTKEQKAEEERKKEEELKKKEEEEKLKALSAQAIIEATLPKGSKRSRPPSHLENKPAGDASRSPPPTRHSSSVSTETVTYTVEEAEWERPKKKSRSSSEEPSQPKEVLADVTVEEIEDVDMDKEKSKDSVKPANSTTQSRSTQFPGFKPSSAPREPSKLRFSFQAESSSGPSTPASTPVPLPQRSNEGQAPTSISATVPSPAPPSIQAVSNGFSFSFKAPSAPLTAPKEKDTESIVRETTKSPDVDVLKARVRTMDAKALPTFALSPTGPTAFSGTPEHVNAREAAKAIHHSSLPTFTFSLTTATLYSFGFDSANPKPVAPLPVKESSSAFTPFPVTTPSSNLFVSLPSKSSIAPIPVTKPTTAGFGVAAVAAEATWNCSQCGLSNPQDASKCTICGEPRLGVASTMAPVPSSLTAMPTLKAQPFKAFDWAAAGSKAPAPSHDTWICGVCGLSSPESATKCTVCDANAPGTASSTAALPTVSSTNIFAAMAAKTTTSSSVKVFDFEAAGMKQSSVENPK